MSLTLIARATSRCRPFHRNMLTSLVSTARRCSRPTVMSSAWNPGMYCKTFSTNPSAAADSPPPEVAEAVVDDKQKPIVKDTKAHAKAEAQLIFDSVWNRLLKQHTKEGMIFPKEIMWLAGAPGAGKGTVTPFIMKERGFTADPIEISQLLTSPAAKALKSQGLMVGDKEVLELLLEKLLDEQYLSGVIVDGFPRTPVQGECIKLLYDRMRELHTMFENTHAESRFRRPVFHVTVLYIDENESVRRQLNRGKALRIHNQRVRETGVGRLLEERPTDVDENLARQRYLIFKDQVQSSLSVVKDRFHFHFINADGSVEEVQDRIKKEFIYQSSLELGDETLAKVKELPLASNLIVHARQSLVRRLDSYQTRHTVLLDRVIDVIKKEFLHILRRQALAGKAIIRTENPVFDEPLALDIALDLLAERGFIAILDYVRQDYPESVDPVSNRILFKKKRVFQFHLEFTRPHIRD
eukprot:GILJ01004024.1.p1 GENE.GILJ01004024.1~~GILJ01004024.1.p1  ORF type:complete len:468 (-),score=80.76 GILJ01004024.1:200-1603(-)